MPVIRHRAPVVEIGDPITSTQRNQQAQALIDLLVSGLGDPTYRIADAVMGLTAPLRNTDASGNLQAPMHEWLSLYQFVDPTEATYPDAGAGEPEGICVVTPVGAFKDGNAAMNVWAEADRLNDFPMLVNGRIPSKDSEWWELGKWQRGWYDPNTGGAGCPAWNVARSHLAIRYGKDSFHGNTFASYAPSPAPSEEEMGEGPGWCDDADWPDVPPSRNWIYYFSSVREGVNATGLHGTVTTLPNGGLRLTYPGTCPTHDGHVLGVYTEEGSNGFIFVEIKAGSGSVWDVLSRRDWMEGPYAAGGHLRRHPLGLNRLLNLFASKFRGTDAQRAKVWLEEAFDTHRFGTSQYHLSPARGQEVGDVLVGHYPGWRLDAAADKGTFLRNVYEGGHEHLYHPGFVCTGFLVFGVMVAGPVMLEAVDGETVLGRFTVAPDEDGNVDKICMLGTAATPSGVRIRLASDLRFTDPAGKLAVEATELYPYQPVIEDWYVVTRMGGVIDACPDGTGMMEELAAAISDHYFRTGTLRNAHDQAWMPGNEANGFGGNAVIDTLRHFTSNCSRIVTRRMLLGIACQGGKTHLWLKRIWDVNGVEVDPWVNLAPGRLQVASGALRPGYRYQVRSGTVWYGNDQLSAGAVFTALAGQAEFGGSGVVFEADGIRAEAPPRGESNQWLLGVWLAPYDQVNGDINEQSIYKPRVYADIYPFPQRCFLGSTELFDRAGSLKWHINQGQPLAWKPEAPSGYIYTPQRPGGRPCNRTPIQMSAQNQLLFFQSCRIYEPDSMIESAVTEIENGVEVVHLTLAGRLHNTSEAVEMDEEGVIGAAAWRAPASFSRDLTTWDIDAIRAQKCRTRENGIQEYLIFLATGLPATIKIGDRFAANPPVEMPGPGSPEGCCFPTFLLTHLPSLVYEDDNDVPNPATDTPLTADYAAQTEFYLRAVGPAYVDGAATEALACANPDNEHLFDFTPEGHCYAAFGKASFNWFASADRPDNVPGFGPVPMTLTRAELFNQFSLAINALTKVRVDLPLNWDASYDHKAGRRATSLDGTSSCQELWTGPTAATTSLGEDGFAYAFSTSTLVKSEGKWWVDSHHQTAVLTAQFADASVRYAIPEAWRDQALSWMGVFCEIQYWEFWNNGRKPDPYECDCGGSGTFTFNPGFTQHDKDVSYCRVFDTMKLEVDPPPECWHYGCFAGGDDCGCSTAGNLRALTVSPKTNSGAYLSVPLVTPAQ